MKITGPREGLRPETLAGGQASRPAGSPAAAGSAKSDAVRASDLSGALGQLGTRLAAEGEFDQPRVDRIKTAITNGEYRVNAEAVADKLIESVRDLLAGKA